MNYLGISCGFHDAAVSLVDSAGNILFAAHSERYSKVKHDSRLHRELIADALRYRTDELQIHYYERPLWKWLRQIRSGQWCRPPSLERIIGLQHLYHLEAGDITTHPHHLSHAAAGFQTSPYDRATVVVIDAIGEWTTTSIWGAQYDQHGHAQYRRLWSQRYPHSIGLFYSALTRRVGLKPRDEEYILMGMSAWGKPHGSDHLRGALIENTAATRFRENMHTGLPDHFMAEYSHPDIAASAQTVVEELIGAVMERAAQHEWSSNLVYCGGVALNCHANRNLGALWDSIWIMPDPGDAGSSLGAALLGHRGRATWRGPYLGHDIRRIYPVDALCDILQTGSPVGIANGRAEWGPRALGNRSLLADPRDPHAKERVNTVKRRQQFRPFAPAILEEYADQYFDMPRGWSTSPYMQVTAPCKRPDLYPAIVHVDGTSRVQTVAPGSGGFRQLLEAWHRRTGCPMLLNTSLNIRGEPMVNDRSDAYRFTRLYGVPVL